MTDEQFWRMTPRQYSLLMDRRRQELLHREMCSAFTTAAVVNCSLQQREQPARALDYMPSHTEHDTATPDHAVPNRELTDEEADFEEAVLRETIRQKQQQEALRHG